MELLDTCISCNKELASWECNRCECLDCQEKAFETYDDDHIELE